MKLAINSKNTLQVTILLCLLIAGISFWLYKDNADFIKSFNNHEENAPTDVSEPDNNQYSSLNEAIEATRYYIDQTKDSSVSGSSTQFKAENPQNSYFAYFTKDNFQLKSQVKDDNWQLQMNLRGFGYGNNIYEVSGKEVQTNKDRIEITKSSAAKLRNGNRRMV